MTADQVRLSLPFVGGITAIYSREQIDKAKENTVKHITEAKDHVVRKYNKLHEMCADKGFQQELLISLGITVGAAIVVFGLMAVYKWWVGYKLLAMAGVTLKTALWFKLTGIAVVGGVMIYQGYRVYDSIDITDEMEKAIS